MGSTWFSVVVDCEDPDRLATFWCAVLGYEVVSWRDGIVAVAPDADAFPGIEFVRTPGHVRRKSPIHLDLNPHDQAAEVDRLLALGARRVDVGQGPDAPWAVLCDPEDNAFCVLRPQPSWAEPA